MQKISSATGDAQASNVIPLFEIYDIQHTSREIWGWMIYTDIRMGFGSFIHVIFDIMHLRSQAIVNEDM